MNNAIFDEFTKTKYNLNQIQYCLVLFHFTLVSKQVCQWSLVCKLLENIDVVFAFK